MIKHFIDFPHSVLLCSSMPNFVSSFKLGPGPARQLKLAELTFVEFSLLSEVLVNFRLGLGLRWGTVWFRVRVKVVLIFYSL